MTLSEFLLDRIADDLALVGAEPGHNEEGGMRIEWGDVGGISDCLLIGEARLRAECKAKRRIVFSANNGDLSEWERSGYVWVLYELAAVYADHPDYLPEWTPEP